MIPGFLSFAAQTLGAPRFLSLAIYDDSKNYIGPGRAALGILRRAYGCDFNPAGWIHDGTYEQGGTEAERRRDDMDFLACCLFIVENTPQPWGTAWIRRPLARQRAMNYYQAVRTGGAACFTYNPRKIEAT